MKSKKCIKSIVIAISVVIINMFFINTSLAATVGKISVETANLREEANAESKILELISLNQEVEILEKSGEWYQVKYEGITGFIRQDLITVEEDATNQEQATQVQTENVQQSDTQSKVENTQQEETKNQEQQEQSVQNTEIQPQEESTTEILGKYNVIKASKLKIIPSINSTEIIEVKDGEQVNVIEIINGWSYIETQNTKGWIRQENLQKVEEAQTSTEGQQGQETTTPENTQQEQVTEKVPQEEQPQQVEEKVLKTQYINSATVNLRKEPNTSSEILTSYALNTPVEVLSEENGWSKVRVSGKEGYMSSSLLSDTKLETSRGATTVRTVKTDSKADNNSTTNEVPASMTNEAPATTTNTTTTSSSTGSAVVETAKQYLGCKYVYGGSSPSGFDCSGFTSYVLKKHGITLNRTAAGQYSNGVAVSRANLQLGDLIMFGKSGINHVGIYIGGGKIIHAANPSRGVTTDTINSGYYNTNYVGARRVI